MTRKLYPPLARIRSELFDTPERRPASADFSETDDAPVGPHPPANHCRTSSPT